MDNICKACHRSREEHNGKPFGGKKCQIICQGKQFCSTKHPNRISKRCKGGFSASSARHTLLEKKKLIVNNSEEMKYNFIHAKPLCLEALHLLEQTGTKDWTNEEYIAEFVGVIIRSAVRSVMAIEEVSKNNWNLFVVREKSLRATLSDEKFIEGPVDFTIHATDLTLFIHPQDDIILSVVEVKTTNTFSNSSIQAKCEALAALEFNTKNRSLLLSLWHEFDDGSCDEEEAQVISNDLSTTDDGDFPFAPGCCILTDIDNVKEYITSDLGIHEYPLKTAQVGKDKFIFLYDCVEFRIRQQLFRYYNSYMGKDIDTLNALLKF